MAIRRQSAKLDVFTKIAILVLVLILSVLIVIPVGNVLYKSFQPGGIEVLRNVYDNDYTRQIIYNTVWLGISVGAIGTAIGFLLAYIQVRVNFRGKKLLHILSLLPLVSPPFAFATAVIVLFGRAGIISNGIFDRQPMIYGYKGLILVLSISYFPVAYMNLLGMLRSLDPAVDEAARSLGASKFKIFRTVTIPLLIPGIAASFLLLFVEAIADLANPLVIGGDYTVLASRAYIAISGEYNIAGGAAYSTILLIPALLVFIIQRYWSQRADVVTVTGKPSGQIEYIRTPLAKYSLLALAWSIVAFVVLIYSMVIMGSFFKVLKVDYSLTLDNYRYIFSGVGNSAILTTTMLALLATPIAGVLGMMLAWVIVRKIKRGGQVLDFFGMLGLALPGTVLGIGYAFTFNSPIQIFGITILPQLAGGGAILGGAMAIVMVYVIRSSPAGQRSGIANLQQIDPSIDEASASLGASGGRTFRKISLPLIRGAFLTGLMFAFARSMTTLSPIIFITTPDTPILTSLILAEADTVRYGNAFAFCTLLIAIVLVTMGLINLLVSKTQQAGYQPIAVSAG
ncbi:MAG: ABC transporter permease [Candidatus Nanopelagicaceae bacterium]